MKTVDPKTLVHVGDVHLTETEALHKWWGGNATERQEEMVVDLIKRIHKGGYWLACDCAGIASPPLLAPALSKGTYFLRRLTKKTPHIERCSFFFEQKEHTGAEAQSSSGVGAMGGIPDFGPRLEGVKVAREKKESSNGEGKQGASTPKMAKMLWWLAHAAGWQNDSKRNPVESIIRLAQDLPFGATGMPLSKALFVTPKAGEQDWFTGSLSAQERISKKPGVCWWIVELLAIEDDKVIVVKTAGEPMRVQVKGKLRTWAGNITGARFPMVAIARIEKDEKLGTPVVAEVYAHPCESSGRWMLLDSDAERATLRDLKSVRAWLYGSKGAWFDIEKPLFEWAGTGEKPDFVIEQKTPNGSHFCIIETMGFEDDEYLARKNDLRQNLLHMAETIMDNRCTAPDPAKLKSAVARWALRQPK